MIFLLPLIYSFLIASVALAQSCAALLEKHMRKQSFEAAVHKKDALLGKFLSQYQY